MARQWFIPDCGQIDEDGVEEFFVPDCGQINEDQAVAVPTINLVMAPYIPAK